MMNENDKELLLQVKRDLNITWNDDDVDSVLYEHIQAGKSLLRRDCGVTSDNEYIGNSSINMLIKAYVRRAYDGDVSDFRNDYRAEIIALQVDKRAKNHAEQES